MLDPVRCHLPLAGRLRRASLKAWGQSCTIIVCSCNFLSDAQVRSVIASSTPRLRMSQIYHSLGCAAEFGPCGHTIKVILEEIRGLVKNESLATEIGGAHWFEARKAA